MSLPVKTKVRTTYQHSETGVVVRPRKSQLPLPSPEWNIVRMDSDNACLCVHDSMLTISNS
jgi:hypothetical protein